MKKLLTLVLISLIALSSTFAAQQPKEIDVTIKATVEALDYALTIFYGNADLTSEEDSYEIANDYTLAETTTTGIFTIKTTKGNQNKDMLFTATVTPQAFKGIVNGANVTTNVIPVIVDTDGTAFTGSLTETLSAGPNAAKTFSTFALKWTGDTTVAAGNYTSDVVISYTFDEATGVVLP